MLFHEFFNYTFCINLERRYDRSLQASQEAQSHGLIGFNRIDGVDGRREDGTPFGNFGCTQSHRDLLRRIAKMDHSTFLVLEDDFMVIEPDFPGKFDELSEFVPRDWDMLYLGGHYGSKPLARVNEHVIKINTMLTTSSYGVTSRFAKTMTEYMDQMEEELLQQAAAGMPVTYGYADSGGIAELRRKEVYLGPVDSVFSTWLPKHNCYILQPRLMVQRPGFSDLTGKEENWSHCMQDTSHERMV